MYFALGFLSAGIVALVLGPPLWRRALRLTRRDMERTLPMTRAEIQAEKDQIRAGFALSISSLNHTIERLKAQVTEQFIDIDRKREVITHLTAQGSLSADDIVAHETRRAARAARLAARLPHADPPSRSRTARSPELRERPRAGSLRRVRPSDPDRGVRRGRLHRDHRGLQRGSSLRALISRASPRRG